MTPLLASLVSPEVLPLAVSMPVIGAVLAPLLSRVAGWLSLAVSMVALLSCAGLLAAFTPAAYQGQVVVVNMGGWAPVAGAQLGITFAVDALGLTFALLCAAVGALLLLFSLSQLSELGSKELGFYACLFQLLLAALIASALTADLLDLFVWFEVAALTSYGLTGFFLERPIALEAAFKIMVATNLASFLLFFAVIVLYGGHGAFNIGQLRAALAAPAPAGMQAADLVALGLLVAALGTKAGLVPFHGWLPDAHSAAPGPVSALFSGLMVNIGVLGVARVVFAVFGPAAARPALLLLVVLGGISAVVGAAMALVQDELKRLLAYDTVSQLGVLAVAAGVATPQSLAGFVYHLVDHGLFKTLLFLCAGAILHGTGMTKLSEMGGLARHWPLLTGLFVVGGLAISGVPPLNGYVSLGLIHGSVEEGHPGALFALTLAQLLTVAALARATYLAFFRRRSDEYDRNERLGGGMLVAFLALAGGCVAFGALPGQVLNNVVRPAAASLTAGGRYAAATIGAGGVLPAPQVSFHYFEPSQLLVTGGTVVAGLVVAWLAVRRPNWASHPPMSWLRKAHTGSVNDYAAYAVAGIVVCAAVCLGSRVV